MLETAQSQTIEITGLARNISIIDEALEWLAPLNRKQASQELTKIEQIEREYQIINK